VLPASAFARTGSLSFPGGVPLTSSPSTSFPSAPSPPVFQQQQEQEPEKPYQCYQYGALPLEEASAVTVQPEGLATAVPIPMMLSMTTEPATPASPDLSSYYSSSSSAVPSAPSAPPSLPQASYGPLIGRAPQPY
jgi:hypothetical protein